MLKTIVDPKTKKVYQHISEFGNAGSIRVRKSLGRISKLDFLKVKGGNYLPLDYFKNDDNTLQGDPEVHT